MEFPLVIHDAAMTGSRDRAGTSVIGEEEFRLFYERTARPLWAYLSRITGDPHKADDFLQEAYYRWYRAGTQYESESHRRNSLFQIATNVVRDAARRHRHYSEVPLEDENTAVVVPVSDAPLPEQTATVRTDLARAMKQLDGSQRELLWLAYGQGASHNEIAAILGVREISVRTLLFRARRKLAALLGGSKAVEQGAGR